MYKPDSFDVDFMIKQLSRAMDSVYPDPERLVGQWGAPAGCRRKPKVVRKDFEPNSLF